MRNSADATQLPMKVVLAISYIPTEYEGKHYIDLICTDLQKKLSNIIFREGLDVCILQSS